MTAWLRDDAGRVRIVRGTNIAADAKLAADRLPRIGAGLPARLRDEMGFDCVRLLVFWDALEPRPGQWDARYLDAVRGLVAELCDAGLEVIVDLHQDVFGEGFGHAGVPEWVAPATLYDRFRPPRAWFMSYLELPVMRAFDALWAEPGRLSAAWRRLASALAGLDGLLACDLINEPSPGTRAPAEFERQIAPAIYECVIDAIRMELPAARVAIEPANTANLGWGSSLRAPSRDRLVYAPHLYLPGVEAGLGYVGGRPALVRYVDVLERDAERLELPLLIGEVGARADVPDAARYLRDVYDLCDERGLGALQWDLSPITRYGLFDASGRAGALARAIVRPHPSRVAGTPKHIRWDAARRRFELRWREDGGVGEETIVTVPALVFPSGARALLDDERVLRTRGSRFRIPRRGGPRRLILEPPD